MNSVHDMGGMDGFGPVEPEPNEPTFHAPWEGRMLAMQRAIAYTRTWHGDYSRFYQESLPPKLYLAAPYYQRWQMAMERLLVAFGLVGEDELTAGRSLRPGKPLQQKLTLEVVKAGLGRGSFHRPPQAPALFKVGDRVRTKNIHPKTHTRLPRYARDKVGIIEMAHGCQVFPDAVTSGKGESPQWLYTVVFTGEEIWGPDADSSLKVSIDAFEPYLEPC